MDELKERTGRVNTIEFMYMFEGIDKRPARTILEALEGLTVREANTLLDACRMAIMETIVDPVDWGDSP